MFGWRRLVVIFASRRKRFCASGSASRCGRIDLTTRTSSRRTWRTMKMAPIPPSLILDRTSYFPSMRAGPRGCSGDIVCGVYRGEGTPVPLISIGLLHVLLLLAAALAHNGVGLDLEE